MNLVLRYFQFSVLELVFPYADKLLSMGSLSNIFVYVHIYICMNMRHYTCIGFVASFPLGFGTCLSCWLGTTYTFTYIHYNPLHCPRVLFRVWGSFPLRTPYFWTTLFRWDAPFGTSVLIMVSVSWIHCLQGHMIIFKVYVRFLYLTSVVIYT